MMLSIDKINLLQAQNECLKKQNKELQKEILSQNDYILQLSAFKDKVEWLEQDIAELKAEKSKYYQQCLDEEIQINNLWRTLQEIKDIAEEYHHNKPRLLCTMDKFIEQILQKIAEVENG